MATTPDFRTLLPSNDEYNRYAPYLGFVYFTDKYGDTDSVAVERTDEAKAINSRAHEIAELANSDFLDPFDITTDDMWQYAERGDTELTMILARLHYRCDQYEEYRVGYAEGMTAMRYEHQY